MKQGIPKLWKWQWLSGFLAVAILSVLYVNQAISYTLTRFSDRAMGAAISHGVDPKLREPVYYLSFIIFILVLYGLWWLFNLLKTDEAIDSLWFSLGLLNLFTFIVKFKDFFVGVDLSLVRFEEFVPLNYSLILLFLTFEMAVLKRILKTQLTFNESIVILFIPTAIFSAFNVLAVNTTLEMVSGTSLAWLSLILLMIIMILNRFSSKRIQLINVLAWILSWIALPKLLLETNLNAVWIIMVITSLLSFITFFVAKKNDWIEGLHFPILISSFFILQYAGQTLLLDSLDYLHLGNRIVPAQQFYQFFSIPLVDYWGAQHFNLGSIAYAIIHGFKGLEPLVWKDLDILFFMLIFYYSFRKLLGTGFTVLVLLFLPMVGSVFGDHFGLINTYYFGALLPLIGLERYVHKPNFSHAAWLTLLSLVTFVWMPSMGKISILSTLALLMVVGYRKKTLGQTMLAWSLVVGLTGIIYFTWVSFNGHSLSDQLTLIKAFASVDFDIASQATLIGYGAQFWQILTLYGIAPLVYMGLFIFFITITRKEKDTNDYLLFYVAIASFISSLRGLARHSLVEYRYHFDFLVLIILVLPYYRKNLSDTLRQVWFIGVAVFCLVFTSIQGVIPNSTFDESISLKPLSFPRVSINPEAYPTQLMNLIKSSLKDNQMFYENINAHLLYALAQTKAPFLHHASQMIYNDSAQNVYLKQWEEYYQDNQIPLVIFSSDTWWGSYIDQIPNEFSTYRISEYVYTHYQPWLRLDGFDVWVAMNSDLMDTMDISEYGPYTQIDPRQSFGVGQIPYLWANYDLENKTVKSLYHTQVQQSMKTLKIQIPEYLNKSKGNYLILNIESNLDQTATVNYLENQFQFTVLKGTHSYAIRISSQYEWIHQPIPQLSFDAEDAKLLDLTITEGD